MALELLKTPRAVELAHWCREQPYWRRNKRLPTELAFPFRVNSAPEITFGMPLLEVVWFTLESWADSDSQGNDLRWALNYPPEQVDEDADPEEAVEPEERLLKAIEHLHQCPRLHWCLRPASRYIIYEFRTLGWDVFSGKTRAEAKKEIMEQLEKQVESKLDETARTASTKPYLEKVPEIREEDQFRHLVLYQVEGLNYSDLTRKVFPEAPDQFNKDKAALTAGIKTAAGRLIGPRVTEWLRPGEPGRPRKA
jgi:hypothetical protein